MKHIPHRKSLSGECLNREPDVFHSETEKLRDSGTPLAGRQGRWLWAVLIATILGIAGAFVWTLAARTGTGGGPGASGLVVLERRTTAPAPPPSEGLTPVLGAVPDFALTDHRGEPFDRRRLSGRIWVVDFIFTRCAGQCLAMAAQMEALQQRLGESEDVALVSFSVDPEYDTPEVLSRYAATHGAQPERWFFLTGDQAVIHRLSRDGFRLGVAETGGTEAEPILHSTRLVLVDGAGRIRGYYDGTDERSVEMLLGDIERLREGSGT